MNNPTKLVSVYVIAEVGGDHVKVGVSDGPNGRLASLQTANPRRLELAYVTPGYLRSRAMELERGVHDALAPFRLAGEWFSCGADTAIESIRCFIDPLEIPPVGENPLRRRLGRNPRGYAIAAILFEYACEKWGDEAFSYGTFSTFIDFGTSEEEPPEHLLDVMRSGHKTWAEARHALFVASGYPTGNYEDDDGQD